MPSEFVGSIAEPMLGKLEEKLVTGSSGRKGSIGATQDGPGQNFLKSLTSK